MIRMRTAFHAAGLLVGFVAATALADVKLPAVIGDHMVLQQGMPVPIWGTADAGEEVTVTLGDQKKTVTAGQDGRWMVRFEPLKAGQGPLEMTVAGKNRLSVSDILVGEVWICSGQSNMQWTVDRAKNATREIAAANYPRIRLFSVPRTVADTPQTDTQAEWTACGPKTIPGFSAVGYFFGRDLHKELDVPVGLIHTSWGGTPAESWTEHSVLAGEADFRPILDRWEENVRKYAQSLADWEKAADKARAEGKPAPKKPADPATNPWKPAGLYNAMISPLVPFAVRGAIWYQGESNAPRAYQYRKLLPAMIKCWRDVWQQDQFAFLIVSLANFQAVKDEPGDDDWAELREAQAMTAAQPGNGLAITIDVGEADDIHPKDKQTVGRRLMLQALKVAYGKDVVASGPVYDSMHIEGAKVRIKFKNAEGLVAKGSVPTGFAVAGEDRKWQWAHADIEGDTVVVWSPRVPAPKAVRYAWAHNPICNLYNAAGLPAVPFRTDDWPGVTVENK
ncbi:MAG TPA: sialate O-acetylesterase [Phycisphaerae bacterium]|jgi:sialate O-acetylesterase|nr:sialate O-acetylesterase [Phycisphaerae bacterium]HOB74636.1 sialate O-acetylesterase [Phycisphaerae bacterium]HOJ53650.1 sialate O-acetylesterase [Phycisphaerae bacterium]HOL26375.1 sialate O-acetylesterase [Phycisphaerae bacterium]HPP21117.1 sialate O-acetylesterase [Phycisphaerae bacterium]